MASDFCNNPTIIIQRRHYVSVIIQGHFRGTQCGTIWFQTIHTIHTGTLRRV